MKVIKYYASWCGPCTDYTREGWQDALDANFPNVHFIEKDIDTDLEAKGMLHAILGKHQIPTTVFIYDDGTTDVAKGPLKLSQIERRIK